MKQTFLVVDDVKTNLRIFSAMLVKMGCFVLVAENGIEAVKLFKNNECDMVLMDYRMPIMNGEEATFKIREIEKQKKTGVRTPIIAVSLSLTNEVKTSLLRAGVDDFITKPVTKDDLAKTIQKYI